MANKSADISVRVAHSVPYPLTVSKLPTLDAMTKADFDTMMETGYNQAVADEGIELDAAFDGFTQKSKI